MTEPLYIYMAHILIAKNRPDVLISAASTLFRERQPRHPAGQGKEPISYLMRSVRYGDTLRRAMVSGSLRVKSICSRPLQRRAGNSIVSASVKLQAKRLHDQP